MKVESKPKRKRRWFQFSLRTLLISVTLLAVACGYIGWEAKIVRDRRALLSWLLDNGGGLMESDPSVPDVSWIRRAMGDHSVAAINLPRGISRLQVDRMKAAFPESAFGFMTEFPGPAQPGPMPRE
jgi:hypothetical protein